METFEEFMTPAELIQEIENTMAETTDDLLVTNGIEQKRHERLIDSTPYGMGMIVRLKEKPRINFKLEIYSNEIEEPHFKVIYQNATCRFKLIDCTPMKAEAERGIPRQINKITKEIKIAWAKNYDDLIKVWEQTRPTDRNLMHQKIK